MTVPPFLLSFRADARNLSAATQFKTLELNHYPMAERLEEIAGVE
jgi:hypothetical protein